MHAVQMQTQLTVSLTYCPLCILHITKVVLAQSYPADMTFDLGSSQSLILHSQ